MCPPPWHLGNKSLPMAPSVTAGIRAAFPELRADRPEEVPPSPIGDAQKSLSQERDRWFESGSLQRRVCCELDWGEGSFAAVTLRSPRAGKDLIRAVWLITPMRAIFITTHSAPRRGAERIVLRLSHAVMLFEILVAVLLHQFGDRAGARNLTTPASNGDITSPPRSLIFWAASLMSSTSAPQW